METPLAILTQSIIDVLTKLQQNVQIILQTRNPSQYEAGLRQLYTSITNSLKEFQSVLSPTLPPTTPIQEPLYAYTLSFFQFCLDFLKNLHRHISAIHYHSLVNKINFCDETLKAIESYITSNTVREDFNTHVQMVDRVSTLLRQGNISELVPSEKSQTSPPGTQQITYRILTAFLDQYKTFLSTLRNTINLSNEYLSGQLNTPCSQIRNQIITSTREQEDSIIGMSQRINSLSFYLKQNDIQNVNNVLGGLPEIPSSPPVESPRVSTLSPSAAADGSYYTFANSDEFDDEADDDEDDRYYYRNRNFSRRRRYY